MDDELYHYGIKGMKWGIRRYQNKDGSLTAEGKKHASDYNKSRSLSKKVTEEGNKLISQNPRLKKDFGGVDMWDDEEFLELTARSYGINTKFFQKSISDYNSFTRENAESIKAGRKIASKLGVNEDGFITDIGNNRQSKQSEQLTINKTDLGATKQIKNDYNRLSDQEFKSKYYTDKKTYAKRVAKSRTGDPLADRKAKMTGKRYEKEVEKEVQLRRLAAMRKANKHYKTKLEKSYYN